MSDNPLDPSPEVQRAVESLAQTLWEQDGRPEDRIAEYRERADEPVEEAAIQENLGEFPGARGTDDQGDWRQMPMTREQLREGYDPGPNHGDHP
jgi:hypothetical protein